MTGKEAHKEAQKEAQKEAPKPTQKEKLQQPRLLAFYRQNIVPEMVKSMGYKNKMQVPHIEKIVINMGIGQGAQDIKILEGAMRDLALIAGQKPLMTRAKKAISNFKIRRADPIGCTVTLRGSRMYEFLDRLVNIALPRIRDFRGMSPTAFDGYGNYNIGLSEQVIFPEIEYDKVAKVVGMNITVATNAKDDKDAYELLKNFGMPFKAKE
ncbi:MAG: 50S ribosomal protein L5 [Candidatus Omnitrophota bacterium]